MPNVLSHPYQLDESISNFRVVGWYFSFYSFKRHFCSEQWITLSDAEPSFAASALVLHCLQIPHKKDTRLIWDNEICSFFTFVFPFDELVICRTSAVEWP